MESILFSVLGGKFRLINAVEMAELLQVPGGADQHDVGKFPGVDILKSRDPFASADAGADHRLLIFFVIGTLVLLFLEKHPVYLLRAKYRPSREMPQWRPPSGPIAPPRRS